MYKARADGEGGVNMSGKRHNDVVIPEVLYEKVKEHIETRARYVFISEVVREAVWDFLSYNSF